MTATAAAGFAAVLGPVAASAQSVEDELGFETIVVTANKREQNAQDIPVTVTSFDAAAIARLGTTEFDDLITQVPGANFLDNGGPGRGNELASLRGLSPVADNTVAVVAQSLDGSPRYGRNYRLYDIGEVSVLRGPQGTLWGGQSIAGQIAIRSNRPDFNNIAGSVQGDVYSSDGDGGLSNRLTIVANAPLIEDRLAARIAVQNIEETGYVDNVFTGDDDINALSEAGWRASLGFRPTDNLEFNVIYQGSDLHTDASSYFSTALGDYQSDNPLAYRPADQDFDLLSLIGEADLGFATLTYTGSFFNLDGNYVETTVNAYGTGALGLTNNLLEQESQTHEVRLQSPDTGRLTWVVGAYADLLEENDLSTQVVTPHPITGTPVGMPAGYVLFAIGGPEDTTEYAIFGEVTYDITDRLEVLVGGRYFDWSVDNQQDYTIFGTNYQQITGEVGDEDFFYKLGLSYRVSDNALIYGLRSEGFRPGGFNPFVGPGLGIPEEYVQFQPDTLINYELGVKTTSFNNRLIFNATAYQMEWQDVQTVVRATSGFAFTTNAPNLEAWGAELELASQDLLLDGLFLSASYAFTKNEFTEDAVIFPGTLPLIAEGEELRRTPRQTWALNAEYAFPITSAVEGFVRTNYWHRDATTTEGFNGADGAVRVPAQDVVNASLGVLYGPVQARLYVDNIGNEAPWLQVFPVASNSPVAAEASTIRPRTVGLELTYRFGAY
ncbi:MAG TPA: TonB-dependent receptor [Verrucomicrobiae bacterium]|nr:TonB-dependent receptor [Verrucomicrobiae bacterium]